MQIIDWKKFVAVTLALKKEAFVIYVAYLGPKILIYLACEAQIALLLAEKISIAKEYTNFLEVFSKKSIVILLNCLDINKHAINLVLGK